MLFILEGRKLTNEAIVDFVNEGRDKALKYGANPAASLDTLLDVYCTGYEALFAHVRDKIDASLELNPNATPEVLEQTQCNRMHHMIVFLAYEMHTAKLIREKIGKLKIDDAKVFDEKFRARSNRSLTAKKKDIESRISEAKKPIDPDGKIRDRDEQTKTIRALKKELKTAEQIFTPKSLHDHSTGNKVHKIILGHIRDAAAAESMHMAADEDAITDILQAFMRHPPDKPFSIPPQCCSFKQQGDLMTGCVEQQQQQPQVRHTPNFYTPTR